MRMYADRLFDHGTETLCPVLNTIYELRLS